MQLLGLINSFCEVYQTHTLDGYFLCSDLVIAANILAAIQAFNYSCPCPGCGLSHLVKAAHILSAYTWNELNEDDIPTLLPIILSGLGGSQTSDHTTTHNRCNH